MELKNGQKNKDEEEEQTMGMTFELSEKNECELRDIVARMLQPGKGILAADDPAGRMNGGGEEGGGVIS